MSGLTPEQLRRVAERTWEEVTSWLVAKPRICEMTRPEQQILFEYSTRLRQSVRSLAHMPAWDRLYFDGSAATLGALPPAALVRRKPPIYLDTHQLLGRAPHEARSATAPDLAVAIHVLRASEEVIELDPDGVPRHQSWMPSSLRAQSWLIDEDVRQLERLADDGVEGYLFVVYSNAAGRHTAVNAREIASWASWTQYSPELWWASRHFRARGPRPA